jgi:hypothetical protein
LARYCHNQMTNNDHHIILVIDWIGKICIGWTGWIAWFFFQWDLMSNAGNWLITQPQHRRHPKKFPLENLTCSQLRLSKTLKCIDGCGYVGMAMDFVFQFELILYDLTFLGFIWLKLNRLASVWIQLKSNSPLNWLWSKFDFE